MKLLFLLFTNLLTFFLVRRVRRAEIGRAHV